MKQRLITIKDWFVGVVLFVISICVFVPLTLINYVAVVITSKDRGKGYFLNTATNIDKFGNQEFRTLFNLTLRTSSGYKFGLIGETISSVLGKNERDQTLSAVGRALAWFLNRLDKNHCIKSINQNISWQNSK